MRLITGPPAPDPGPARPVLPPSAGVYRLVKGARWSVRTSVLARRGPASCGPAHLARNDPLGGAASRTSLLPSCADTARIRRDEGRKKQAVAGLVRAADSRPGRATATYCRSATVIASVDRPRCLMKRK
jgi:hypothetical protein